MLHSHFLLKISFTVLIFHTERDLTILTFFTAIAFTALIFLTELALTILTFLTEIPLTVLIFHTELAVTILTFLTEITFTVQAENTVLESTEFTKDNGFGNSRPAASGQMQGTIQYKSRYGLHFCNC